MFTVGELLEATGGKLISGTDRQMITGISTDSRTISQRELFVALEGENFNGHNFVNECLLKGAIGAIVRAGKRPFAHTISAPVIIEVPDTLKALGDIAHFHRMRFNIPVIGITGSNGKTTTKDMTAHLVSVKYNTLKNQGTFNNLVGVPLTLFKLSAQHQACVLEMGTSKLGEIKRLSEIARPNIGLITNIGPSHLEFFKDLDTVFRAKAELFEQFSPDDLALWNADDVVLNRLKDKLISRKKTFGLSGGCNFRATNIEYVEGGWRFALNSTKLVKIKLLGKHNIHNALAAICIADTLGIEYADFSDAIENFNTPSMRMELLQVRDVTVINDCYNSNPQSVESAINVLANFNVKARKILVSADMLELGQTTAHFHRKIGFDTARAGIDIFIGVGPMSKEAVNCALSAGMSRDSVWFCNDAEQAGELLLRILKSGDVVLIKGSRAMKMEKVCSTISSIR